jgi:hypothetical protein
MCLANHIEYSWTIIMLIINARTWTGLHALELLKCGGQLEHPSVAFPIRMSGLSITRHKAFSLPFVFLFEYTTSEYQ